MNKPWYLMPFIIIYKFVFFIILLPWNILKLASKYAIIGSNYFYKYIVKNVGKGLYKGTIFIGQVLKKAGQLTYKGIIFIGQVLKKAGQLTYKKICQAIIFIGQVLKKAGQLTYKGIIFIIHTFKKGGMLIYKGLTYFFTMLSLGFYMFLHFLKHGIIVFFLTLGVACKKIYIFITKVFFAFILGIKVTYIFLVKVIEKMIHVIFLIGKSFFFGIYSILYALKSVLYRGSLSMSLYNHRRRELAKERKIEKAAQRKIKKQKKIEMRQAKKDQMQKRKEEKQLAKQQRLSDKKRMGEEKKARREKENDVYTNENVIFKKKTIGTHIKAFFLGILKSPITLKNRIIKKYKDSSFVKNARNKKDMNRQALLINFEGDDAVKSDKKILYEYVAKNAEGKVLKDYFEAFSKVEVHSFLLSEGYEVYSIKSSRWINFLHGRSSVNRVKIKVKDLIFFVTQLSTYIKAGIPLAEALKILSRQYKKTAYKKIFSAIIYDLTMGESFSEALSKQGNAFPRLLINMIKTAEMTGELPESLDDMADYYTESDKTKKQMITALMYPAMVMVFATGVIVFILIWVIPQFVGIYESMDASKIPSITLLVIDVSNFLKKYIVFLLVGFVALILIVVYLYKNIKMFRTVLQWIAMHVPVLGNVIIYNELTMFTKTFSSLLKHNVFITESMDILNKITNNEIYKMLILDTITNIARGDKISLAFKDHWAFPIPAYEMLVTGEKTGQLPDMMAKVSTYYQELHAQSVGRIKTFIEPILIIFLTVMVGIIILAIILPMFGMYDMIQ